MFKPVLVKLANWTATRISKPRFWTDEEWNKFSSKEKIWVWYKHHWNIKSYGSAEADNFTMPIKDLILYGGIIMANALAALAYFKIEFDYFALLFVVGISCTVLWTINFVWQWTLGDWKDKNDFIALEQEIGNKRNKVFREIREQAKKEKWRQSP